MSFHPLTHSFPNFALVFSSLFSSKNFITCDFSSLYASFSLVNMLALLFVQRETNTNLDFFLVQNHRELVQKCIARSRVQISLRPLSDDHVEFEKPSLFRAVEHFVYHPFSPLPVRLVLGRGRRKIAASTRVASLLLQKKRSDASARGRRDGRSSSSSSSQQSFPHRRAQRRRVPRGAHERNVVKVVISFSFLRYQKDNNVQFRVLPSYTHTKKIVASSFLSIQEL